MNRTATLHSRLRLYARSWADIPVGGLASYTRADACPRRGSTWSREGPYWITFPQAIWTAWRPSGRKADARLLDDVLWGQFCAFLFVRIHDDLLDAQARDGRLVFIADDLLLESQRAFATYLDRPDFRALFDRHMRATLRAVLDVDTLQARPGAMTRARLCLHARVSAIFNLGSAAVCLACRRPWMIARFEHACASLAVAGQLVDDLLDMEEDLARGRYNFVANVFGGRRPLPRNARARERRIADAILQRDAVGEVVAIVRGYVERAKKDLAPARIPEIDAFLEAYVADVDRIRDGVHRARVARAFGWS